MRLILTLLGVAAILTYAILGAMLMNDWAVAAASGEPIDETIAAMDEAGQTYSVVPGIAFAVIGAGLAIGWAVLTLRPTTALPGWASLALWATILAAGALAYFFASFGNMNSVGDTYFEWHADAAFALQAPLYLVSAAAAITAPAAVLVRAIAAAGSTRRSAIPGS